MTGESKSVTKKPGEHNHLPPEKKILQENFRKTLIQSVEHNVSRNLKKSYDEAIQGTSEEILPNILPESPKTLEDVKIEGAWRKTKQGKEFEELEVDLVIFGTTEGLEFSVRSKILRM